MSQLVNRNQRAAFTLIELLVVLLVLTLLAVLMVPVMAGTRTDTKAGQCLNNLRRLTAAWSMYSSDNSDSLPAKWVANGIDWTSNPDNTNAAKLKDPTQSLIAQYVQSADLFKCPADNYQSPLNPGPRVMSVSVNAVLGQGIQPANVFNQIPGRTYISKFTRFTQLNKPGPANTAVVLDEHPDSIDDALFISRVGCAPASAFWVNRPGFFHNGAATISFADGRAILRRWLDSRTVPPVVYYFPPADGLSRNINVPGSPDYVWLNDHMPYQ